MIYAVLMMFIGVLTIAFVIYQLSKLEGK